MRKKEAVKTRDVVGVTDGAKSHEGINLVTIEIMQGHIRDLTSWNKELQRQLDHHEERLRAGSGVKKPCVLQLVKKTGQQGKPREISRNL